MIGSSSKTFSTHATYGDKIAHLLELKDEIHQTRQSSYSMIRQNSIHNSKVGINKTSPDILYKIFALAVYSSSKPGTTALNISYVCHYWRESALRWPVLWAFVTLDFESSIFDLFIKRSQNAPLTLTCGWDSQFNRIFNQESSTAYFIPHANSILSRSCSLIINTSYPNFARLNRVIQNSKCPPLQLQRLNIRLFGDQGTTKGGQAKPSPLACLIDNSCLRVIQLEGCDLPKLQLPHNKLLMHLTLKYINPPPLSQLLAFLSNCPSLKVFELELQDRDRRGVQTIFDVTTSTNAPIDKLGFVNLARLGFGARGPSSLDFIRRFSGFIRILGTLSQFKLCYITPRDYFSIEIPKDLRNPVSPSVFFQIFEAVRPGLFPSLSDYQYLSMALQHYSIEYQFLKIYGDNSASRHRESDNSCPLVINFENRDISYLPILTLVKAMPQIQHLKLTHVASFIFILWPNIHDAFPCLHTLEFAWFHTNNLQSLPEDLRIKKLILGECCVVSSEVLFRVVVRMGVEDLEATKFAIWDSESMTPERRAEITSAFRERGYDGPRVSEPVGISAH